jgi:hypothetical protein
MSISPDKANAVTCIMVKDPIRTVTCLTHYIRVEIVYNGRALTVDRFYPMSSMREAFER